MPKSGTSAEPPRFSPLRNSSFFMAPAFHPGKSSPAWFRRTRNALGEFLTGNGLPVFLTAAALIYEIFLLLVIFALFSVTR